MDFNNICAEAGAVIMVWVETGMLTLDADTAYFVSSMNGAPQVMMHTYGQWYKPGAARSVVQSPPTYVLVPVKKADYVEAALRGEV